MRRLTLLVLLVLLPLQWGAAMAARALPHTAHGSHFGHHLSAPADAAASQLADRAANAAAADVPLPEHPHCGGCHGPSAVCVNTALPPWPQALAAAAPSARLPQAARTPVYDLLRPPQILPQS